MNNSKVSLHIPQKPINPRIKMNIALAGVSSLFAGIFLAFFMKYIERMKSEGKD